MRNSTGAFTPEALARVLFSRLKLPRTARYHVAFSGGADSTALLHALAVLSGGALRITALHADHGLVPDSIVWAEHCRRFCARMHVPILIGSLHVRPDPVQGIEASARHARYGWFADTLGEGDLLLTAHHLDDQAETVLLRLLRGAGLRGLAGIPELRPLGASRLVRPLLNFSREELADYNERQGLAWIDDPANRDTRFDRSWLRREISPRLREHWTAAPRLLAQTADHAREAAGLLDELAENDVAECRPGPIPWAPGSRVFAAPLERLSAPRQANALRYLLRQHGFAAPSTSCMRRALTQLLRSDPRGPARVFCDNLELRRYDDWLELARPLPRVSARWHWTWADFPAPLTLPELGVRLVAVEGVGGGFAVNRMETGGISVRLRRGGERVLLPGRAHHHAVKNLLNKARVPSWHRDRLPLLYDGERIIALPGLCVSAPFACAPGERGWRVQITAP